MSQESIDYGISAMRDPETGDVYMDKDGNFTMLSGEDVLRQECLVALLTIRGEEPFDTEYGFPLRDVIVKVDLVDMETAIKSAIHSTLKSERVPFLHEARVIEISGEDGILTVNIMITSINNISYNLALGVDKLFQSDMG